MDGAEPSQGEECSSETSSTSFDDVELGNTPLLSSGKVEATRGPGGGAGGGSVGGAGAGYRISSTPGFIELEVSQASVLLQQLQKEEAAAVQAGKGGGAAGKVGPRPASFSVLGSSGAGGGKAAPRPASFSLLATSGRTSTAAASQPPPLYTTPTAWPSAAEVEAEEEEEAGSRGAQGVPQRLSALALMAVAPVKVPVCSVLFSLVSSILALVFFVLFLAHHDRFEVTGCTLLISAASAAAGPSSLMLLSVRDPATLVCLGKEDHGPLVIEDSLAALLVAHPQSFEDAHAQLSFTPAGRAERWGISLEVQGLTWNASAGSATIQVEDWEAAAAADAGTVYPGTEAFEAQFGAGAPLGQPLLVFRLDDDGLVGALGR